MDAVFKNALHYSLFVECSEKQDIVLKPNEFSKCRAIHQIGNFVGFEGNFSDNNIQWCGNLENAGRKLGCTMMAISRSSAFEGEFLRWPIGLVVEIIFRLDREHSIFFYSAGISMLPLPYSCKSPRPCLEECLFERAYSAAH